MSERSIPDDVKAWLRDHADMSDQDIENAVSRAEESAEREFSDVFQREISYHFMNHGVMQWLSEEGTRITWSPGMYDAWAAGLQQDGRSREH